MAEPQGLEASFTSWARGGDVNLVDVTELEEAGRERLARRGSLAH